jgi:hypothetical protein
MAEKSCCGNQ